MDIKKVVNLGAGLMGSQIAIQVAIHGYEVVCYDIKPEIIESAAYFSRDWFERRVAKGKMESATAEKIQSRLTFTTEIKSAALNADFVIEAVSDIVAIKKIALAQIDALTPDHCIYASNSSYIVSSRFADAVKDQTKVINVHFFNPALVMKIVEVGKGISCFKRDV